MGKFFVVFLQYVVYFDSDVGRGGEEGATEKKMLKGKTV
jgi:hypothetical protein